jgi:tetrahedral aminopeptidase
MNIPLLKRLTEAHGVPGQEDAIRAIVREEMQGLGEISVDSMGSLHCVRKGKGANPKKLMIAAHMDEIGFVVKFIEKEGFLRLQPLGGWDPRQMASQRVVVGAKEGPLKGLLVYGTKPAHLLSDAEKKEGPKMEGYFVDLGLPAEEVQKRISKGDPVTMDRGLLEVGNHLACKAMDDRCGLYVMIEALRAAKDPSVEVHAIATVQEEIGLRGAAASGAGIAPHICVALDVTLANDIPGVPEVDQITKLGDGAAIKFMDSSLLCHPKVFAHFRDLAEKHKIKHQIEVLPMGGTDAGAIQRLHGGIPSFTLSIPTRYIHTVNETVHPADVDAAVELLARFIEDAHNGDYTYS